MTAALSHFTPGLSHACLICGGTAGERLAAARAIAAAAVCGQRGEGEPCGVCRHCRKAGAGTHPDIISVDRQTDENGRARREIYVSQVRALIAGAYIMPNEARRKVYIIPEAETMNQNAQNALLRLLEDPPGGVMLILCAESRQSLLPTVCSRCTLSHPVRQTSQADDAPDTARESAARYVGLAVGRDTAGLLRFCAESEKLSPQQASLFIGFARENVAERLRGSGRVSGSVRLDGLLELAELLDTAEAYLRQNVGVKHVFGLLAVDAPCSREGKERTEN